MVRYDQVFETAAVAEAKKAELIRNYHPAGYGTTIKVEPTAAGQFRMTGFRYSSCD